MSTPYPPSPPSSLLPVSLGNAAGVTGPYPRSAPRPTMTTGVAILLVGAIVGSVAGIGMRVRQTTTASLTQAIEATPAALAAISPPAPISPIVVAPGGPTPEAAAPGAYSAVPFGSLVVAATPAPSVAAPKKTAKPAVHVVVAPTPKPAPVVVAAKPAAPVVAAKPAAPVVAAKPAAEPKPAPEAKPVVKEAKPAARDAETDRMLRAAKGATENTL